MSESIQYKIENAISGLFSSLSGINVYSTNRTGKRLFPYITIQVFIRNQLLGNYTGVYELSAILNYSDTAVKVTQEDFDSKYCEIFESLYSETPTLKDKIQAELISGTCYMARIESQDPTIRTNKRAWQRGLKLAIYATPESISGAFVPSLDFSDYRNSQYIGTI